jgi:hypothetical protein
MCAIIVVGSEATMTAFLKSVASNIGTNAGMVLIGTVFGAAGWLVTYTVDEVTSVPTVEYDVAFSQGAEGEVTATIRNISRDHKFSNLLFLFRLPTKAKGQFEAAKLEAIPPAYTTREKPEATGRSASYPSLQLHPGTSVKLTATYSGEEQPIFLISPEGERARLLKKSYATWILRNDIEVLAALFVLWVVAVLLIVSTMRGLEENDANP